LLPPDEQTERARLNDTLRRLEGAQHSVPAADPAATPPPLVEYSVEHGVFDLPVILTGGVAAGLFVAWAVLGLESLSAEAEATGFVATGPDDALVRMRLDEKANDLALAADVVMVAGAAFAVTAVLL